MNLCGMNSHVMRGHNKAVIISHLYREKIASKSTLARLSQLSIQAVSNILDELLEEGYLCRLSRNLHTRGNNSGSFQIATRGNILCLNISPFLIEGVLVDGLVRPLLPLRQQPARIDTPGQLAREIERQYHAYRQHDPQTPLRIALSIHGQVNPRTGVSERMPQALWHEPVELRYLLEEKLSTRLLMDNDCVMLALAEKWQNMANAKDFCVINVDYGIGSSFVIDREIYRGTLFGSGQIGHTIIDPDGAACSCGRYGCLETIASLSSLKKKVRMQLKMTPDNDLENQQINTAWLLSQFHAGNPSVRLLVHNAARAIGLSLYNFLNILNINRIYLYGRSCQFGAEWLGIIHEQTHYNPFDRADTTRDNATLIEVGGLTRQQQVMGIGFLYAEDILKNGLFGSAAPAVPARRE
ncbi:ROK family transcriptional regulator [Acerihabitans sp.]|uniref:ROK family transcriptional regulator n=1 Tax=Acerihabitans sp. TaxID=2811394 RepID=UPI002EDAE413